jgi:hypothetical protein
MIEEKKEKEKKEKNTKLNPEKLVSKLWNFKNTIWIYFFDHYINYNKRMTYSGPYYLKSFYSNIYVIT